MTKDKVFVVVMIIVAFVVGFCLGCYLQHKMGIEPLGWVICEEKHDQDLKAFEGNYVKCKLKIDPSSKYEGITILADGETGWD